jgi:hypothetical protein
VFGVRCGMSNGLGMAAGSAVWSMAVSAGGRLWPPPLANERESKNPARRTLPCRPVQTPTWQGMRAFCGGGSRVCLVVAGQKCSAGNRGESEGGRGWVDAFSPGGIKRTDWRAAGADLESAASAWPVDERLHANERFCSVQITHYHGQRVTEAGFSHRASDLLPLPLLVRDF